jgi:hypothetical protein
VPGRGQRRGAPRPGRHVHHRVAEDAQPGAVGPGQPRPAHRPPVPVLLRPDVRGLQLSQRAPVAPHAHGALAVPVRLTRPEPEPLKLPLFPGHAERHPEPRQRQIPAAPRRHRDRQPHPLRRGGPPVDHVQPQGPPRGPGPGPDRQPRAVHLDTQHLVVHPVQPRPPPPRHQRPVVVDRRPPHLQPRPLKLEPAQPDQLPGPPVKPRRPQRNRPPVDHRDPPRPDPRRPDPRRPDPRRPDPRRPDPRRPDPRHRNPCRPDPRRCPRPTSHLMRPRPADPLLRPRDLVPRRRPRLLLTRDRADR